MNIKNTNCISFGSETKYNTLMGFGDILLSDPVPVRYSVCRRLSGDIMNTYINGVCSDR